MKQTTAPIRFNVVSMTNNANITIREVGSRHLITEIPEDEQFDMHGIEEQGPDWKFKRKFTSRFYLSSSKIAETGEFLVTKSSDWDILISQKHIRCTNMSVAKEAEQREFEWSQQELLENQSRLYEEREKMKRSSQLESRHLSAVGRAWTVDDNKKAIMPTSISEASGGEQGDLPIQMDSIDDQSLAKLRDASIRFGTMQD
ncbi:hypothetical protein BHYA_0015g00010 [Botrytis hyacinthi]|uniref:Uncharacterized protein n=1 Tax=Botrytis hyacinthi TaxID=278943 RepID=A0A4Z1GZA0_9HELO|nr:hypothetical protein BHYA_0015g00010 [Botrytis hyacinthi]